MSSGAVNLESLLHLGTSGWSYKHWQGLFYPEELKPNEYLEFYSSRFSCVELNASFYHTPSPKVIANWRRRSPDGFYFCVKVSRYITHRQRLDTAAEGLAAFLTIFQALDPKLGPFLVQLPPSLIFQPALAVTFFRELQKYAPYRFAIEPRHSSWFSPEALQMMQEFNLCVVISDSGGIYPQSWHLTTDFVYLRWHGAHGLYYSPYSTEELQKYADKILSWLKVKIPVWGFFNNDAQAHAVFNALELKALITAQFKS